MVSAKDVFTTDYTNLERVINLARKMATAEFPMAVIKHPDRTNYNITFVSRAKELPNAEIVWRSDVLPGLTVKHNL